MFVFVFLRGRVLMNVVTALLNARYCTDPPESNRTPLIFLTIIVLSICNQCVNQSLLSPKNEKFYNTEVHMRKQPPRRRISCDSPNCALNYRE